MSDLRRDILPRMDQPSSESGKPETELEHLRKRNVQLEAARQHTAEALHASQRSQARLQALPGQLSQERQQKHQAQEELAQKIEELEQANIQLRQLDAMKDNFLSLLSHEFRTPVSAILGYVSILDDELAGPVPAQQHEYLDKVQQEADKLLVLINNTLDMNRLQSGQMTIDRRPVNLTEVLQNVLFRLEETRGKKGLRLANTVEEDFPVFLSDEQRLGQILGNLLDNAMKFTPAGGTVWIRARHADARLSIEIEDTGVGISPDNLPHLFQIFGQLDTSSTRAQGGLGLGLALAQGLAQAMGGAIEVHSTLDRGSVFVVQLPFEEATE